MPGTSVLEPWSHGYNLIARVGMYTVTVDAPSYEDKKEEIRIK